MGTINSSMSEPITVEFLKWIHGFSLFIHSVMCVIYSSIIYVDRRNGTNPALWVGYRNDPDYPYEADVGFGRLFAWNFMGVFVSIEAITALFNIGYIVETTYGKKIQAWSLKGEKPTKPVSAAFYNGSHELRWVEYSITATLGTLAQLVGTGGNSWDIFLCVVGFGVILQVYGLQSERAIRKADAWLAFFMGWVAQGVVWVVLFTAFNVPSTVLEEVTTAPPPPPPNSTAPAEEKTDDFVWPIWGLVTYTLWYFVFPVILGRYLVLREYGPDADNTARFLQVEAMYAVASVSSKFAISGYVICTVRQMLEYHMEANLIFEPILPEGWWVFFRVLSLAAPFVAAIGLTYRIWRVKPKEDKVGSDEGNPLLGRPANSLFSKQKLKL